MFGAALLIGTPPLISVKISRYKSTAPFKRNAPFYPYRECSKALRVLMPGYLES